MSKKLFQLVKSMSAREKGYFKTISFKHTLNKQNIYMNLFDVIDGMDVYEPSHLQSVFKKKKAIKEVAAYTNYLFVNILDALKTYHTRKTVDSTIRELLLDVEILYEKKLFVEAGKLLAKAKKKASTHEKFSLLIEAINWEEKIATILYDPHGLGVFMKSSHPERLKVATKLNTSIQFKGLLSSVNLLSWQLKGKAEQEKLKVLMHHPLLRNDSKATSLTDKNTFYFIHSLYHFIKPERDLKKSVAYIRKQKELMESNLEWSSENIYGYLGILNNLMVTCFQAFNLKEVEQVTLDLKNMPERFGVKINDREENMRRSQILDTFFGHCILSAGFEIAVTAIKGKDAEWEEVYAKTGKRSVLFFYGHIRNLFFATQNFKKALLWNNKILTDKDGEVYPAIYVSAVTWNTILHFEIGNLELVESLSDSALRTFKKGSMQAIDWLVLTNFQNLFRAKNQSTNTLVNAFMVLKKKTVKLREVSPTILNPNTAFYLAWMDSYLEKKKYVEIFKRYMTNR